MVTFLEIAARSVSNLFSMYFVYLYFLFISRFGFKSGICLLIAPVPVHCFSITLMRKPVLAYAKTKAQISCKVTKQLIRAIVLTTLIVQSHFFLNAKFQASGHLL